MPYCPNCGKEVPADARFCPSCAASLGDQYGPTVPGGAAPGPSSSARAPTERNALVALVLSVIFAGLGQLYLGLRRRGLIFAVVGVVLVAWFYSFEVGDLYPLLWAYGIYDTYRTCIRVAGLRPRVAPVIVLVVLEIVALLFVVGSFLG